jgi:hypothetical protein
MDLFRVSFADDRVVPNVPMNAFLFDSSSGDPAYGLLDNPNESYLYDYPYDEEVPESWYRNKVYNLEVEDFHTYFVDTMGVWVHNNNACMTDSAALTRQANIGKVINFDKTTVFHDFVRSLKPEELKGTYLAPETFFDPADIDTRWKEVQHNTHGIYKDGKLYAIAVLGKSPFGDAVVQLYGKHGDGIAHIDDGADNGCESR